MIETSKNVERTGDRDLEFSKLMRLPKGIRVIDIDPSPICRHCKNFMALFEAKRFINPTDTWLYYNSEYLKNLSLLSKIEAYIICSIDWQNIKVTRVSDFEKRQFNRQEYVNWVESIICPHCKLSSKDEKDEKDEK